MAPSLPIPSHWQGVGVLVHPAFTSLLLLSASTVVNLQELISLINWINEFCHLNTANWYPTCLPSSFRGTFQHSRNWKAFKTNYIFTLPYRDGSGCAICPASEIICRWKCGWGIFLLLWGLFLIVLWNAVFSTSWKWPRVQSPDCGWQERQWLLNTRYLVLDLSCTGIFLDSAIAVAASWFSKLPGRQRCESFPGGLFCRILGIVLGDLAYGPVLHSFHQFPKYLIPYIKYRSA